MRETCIKKTKSKFCYAIMTFKPSIREKMCSRNSSYNKHNGSWSELKIKPFCNM